MSYQKRRRQRVLKCKSIRLRYLLWCDYDGCLLSIKWSSIMATACHFNNFLGLGSSARGLIPLWILSILLCSLFLRWDLNGILRYGQYNWNLYLLMLHWAKLPFCSYLTWNKNRVQCYYTFCLENFKPALWFALANSAVKVPVSVHMWKNLWLARFAPKLM